MGRRLITAVAGPSAGQAHTGQQAQLAGKAREVQFKHHRLAHHRCLAGFDQAPRSEPLPCSLQVRRVLDAVPGEDVGVEADHVCSREAGSKSAGTALRHLSSMPKPDPGAAAGSTGELLTRISMWSPTRSKRTRLP